MGDLVRGQVVGEIQVITRLDSLERLREVIASLDGVLAAEIQGLVHLQEELQ